MKHIFFALLLVSPVALACPPGYSQVGGGSAGYVGCAPIPGYNGGQPADPGPQWSTRWGAIATDGKGGAFGAASDQPSKRKASKSALSQCKERGGKKCKVLQVTHNQCQALAWGDSSNAVFKSPGREDAEISALKACGINTTNCRIHYAACSYPVRVR